MKIKITLLLLFLLTGVTVDVLSQEVEKIYRMENGTVLSGAQLDSLSKVYEDRLRLKYNREGGKIVVIVTLPQDSASTRNAPISTGFSASDENESLISSEGDSLTQEIIFMNTEDEEISKEEYTKLLEVLGAHSQYSITVENGIKRVVMRPSTNENVQEMSRKMDAKKDSLNSMIGKVFPFETMTDLGGTIYTPKDMAGKVVVLNYWFVECAPCIREMPFLNELAGQYQNRDDILFLAPSLSDSQKIKKMLETRPFEYTLIPDAAQQAGNIGIFAYPTNLVMDRSGIVIFMEIGYHEDTVDKLRRNINEVLK